MEKASTWKEKGRRMTLKKEYLESLRIAGDLLSQNEKEVADDNIALGAESMYDDVYHEHLAARRQRSAKEKEEATAFDAER